MFPQSCLWGAPPSGNDEKTGFGDAPPTSCKKGQWCPLCPACQRLSCHRLLPQITKMMNEPRLIALMKIIMLKNKVKSVIMKANKCDKTEVRMKTRFLSLILALTLLLPCLIACDSGETHSPTGGGTTSAKPTQSSAQNADSGEIPMTETDGELDYSWFEFPSPTKELCIYTTENLRVLTVGAERFEAQYPDVNVNISFLDEDQFRELIRAEIMAGKGPDLVCCESVVTFPALYKTMTTGIFTDLNPYLMNDPDFHKEDFFEEVLEAGMLGSSLFVMPIECKVPILMTSEEALRDEGISSDDLLTYEGFTEACIRYHENHPDNNLMTMGSTDYYLSQFFDTSAIGFIDYGNQTVSVDEDALHKLIDVCRAYYHSGCVPVYQRRKAVGHLLSEVSEHAGAICE